MFAALTADQQRTAQICADVAAAATARRTCLVLTQRTSHIDAICAHLARAGHTAHVLKGGLGKRAVAAVHDAMAAPDRETGTVVVATGSYLDEGFDWPEGSDETRFQARWNPRDPGLDVPGSIGRSARSPGGIWSGHRDR